MAELSQKLMTIFANIGATGPSGEGYLAVFGSYKNGTKTYSTNRGTLQSLSYWGSGIKSALINGAPIAVQELDAVCNVLTGKAEKIQEYGTAGFRTDVEYFIGTCIGSKYVYVKDNVLLLGTVAVDYFQMTSRSRTSVLSNNSLMATRHCALPNNTTGQYLPAASSYNKGMHVSVWNSSGASRTIIVESSGTIDGASSYVLTTGKYAEFMSTGTEWNVVLTNV